MKTQTKALARESRELRRANKQVLLRPAKPKPQLNKNLLLRASRNIPASSSAPVSLVSSIGLLTPVFSTLGVGLWWYRVAPKSALGSAIKYVVGQLKSNTLRANFGYFITK